MSKSWETEDRCLYSKWHSCSKILWKFLKVENSLCLVVAQACYAQQDNDQKFKVRAGDITWWVECLPSMHEVLGSIPQYHIDQAWWGKPGSSAQHLGGGAGRPEVKSPLYPTVWLSSGVLKLLLRQ